MSNYSDDAMLITPDQFQNRVKECKTYGDIYNEIINIFPSWIVATSNKYADEYTSLTQNWKCLCDRLNTTPYCILLVEYLNFDTQRYQILNMICEVLTSLGVCVRRADEFILCDICNSALPNKDVYKNLKGNKPANWKQRCLNC